MATWYVKLLQNPFLNGISGKQVALLLSAVIPCFHSHAALAQITPDITWGSENSVTGSGTVGGQPAIQIGGGAIRNTNLFHSFQNFNVADGQRVYFVNPAGIQTILARVTGNTPSNILGTLGVDGAASLFLINPNGILFGPNSRLDVRGSFITTTAHEVQFGNQGLFRVSDPQAPPLLTVNPSALWFTQMATQPIVHRSTADGVGLQIAARQSVLFVGGDVQLEGGRILAPGARVELAGVARQGVIPLQVQNHQWQLSFPDGVDRANVTLTNDAQINVRSQGGGDIIVQAKNFTMTGSDTQLLAGIEPGTGSPETQAGNIEIKASGLASLEASLIDNAVLENAVGQGGNIQLTANSLSLLNGAQFSTGLAGQGNAGNMIIQVQDTIWLDGVGRRGSSGLRSVVEPDAIGNGGEITVTARSLVAQNGGSLASFTRGRGNAGNISLDIQDTTSFLGVYPSPFSLGSFSSGIFTAARNFGNGGEIRITTNSLLVQDGARLNSSTFGQGSAGSIIITARDTVLLDGVSNTLLPVNSGIFSAVEFSRAVGRGGDITISTTNLFVKNGANIRSGSNGTGNSGNITIVARELAAWDGTVGEFVSSADTAVESDRFGRATGSGGDLRVTARNIFFTNGARLNASLVNADGRAGNIFVQATERVTLSGFDSKTGNPSGFGTFTAGNTTGDGGNIFVSANTLTIANGAFINAQSLSNGPGGTITVNTGQLLVQNGGQITAEGRSAGAAGAIAIATGSLNLWDQGRITAETASSTGGNISLNVQDILLLRRHSLISATAGTAAAGGDGGNIRINARFIVSNPDENSDITANAFSGRGGRVEIDTLGIFGFVPRTRLDLERALQTTDPARLNPQQLPSNDITAISQTSPSLSGIVAITTPNLDPIQFLTQLPDAPVDASRLINQSSCAATQGNQFLVTGRGGLPDSPVAMLSPTVGWEDWRMAERDGRKVRSPQPAAKKPEPQVRQPERIVEAQGWLRSEDGSIWLTATPAMGTPSLSESPPAMLVQRGQQHYNAGQFAEAISVLQQTASAYAAVGDGLKQAQTLAFLSLAQQKLGQWSAARAAIATSLQLLQNQPGAELVRAQVLNAEGHWQRATGDRESALDTWQTAQSLYARAGDTVGQIGSQINQVQALQMLGFYRRAQQVMERLEQQLLLLSDTGLQLAGLHTLGNLRRQAGELEQAKQQLQAALARSRSSVEDESKILISLGNTEKMLAGRFEDWEDPTEAERHLQAALAYYRQAIAIAPTPLTRIQAQLNALGVQRATHPSSPLPTAAIAEIGAEMERLPASRAAIDGRIHFAHRLLPFSQQPAIAGQIAAALHRAMHQAEQLQDPRAISSALGMLGAFYERRADWSRAEMTTQRALQVAQAIGAADLSYQWQWQLGRLHQAQKSAGNGKLVASPVAIAYYREALQTLTTLRSDLVALSPDIQFSFREQVEPVYREYVDLLLRADQPPVANLITARTTIEALQLAELDNFFRDACARPQPVNIDDLDPTAAIVYPILLPDRLEVIVKLPGQNRLRHARQPGVSEAQVDQAVAQLRRSLQRRSTSPAQVKREARQLYDWLLKPFAADLMTTGNQPAIKTLVFVLDGSLRNIPPSVLFDGERYLIERYAIAITPGLHLLDPKPLPQRQAFNALIAGATNAPSFQQEKLAALENVALELTGIEQQVNRSHKLENQQFLKANIQTQINAQSFNIVHIATHGQFSSNPEQTFILDWLGRIQVKDLDTLLRRDDLSNLHPIELLVLSACETATGDQRAALGLAGVAIRAGARSTVATLFQVNDVSTAELMVRFYQQLNDPTLTKAEALRRAQLSFLQDQQNGTRSELSRPYFWSPFILVGNWL